MSRWIWILCCGSLAVSGCEPQPAAPVTGKPASEVVGEDAGKPPETASEHSQKAQEEFKKSLELRLAEFDAQLEKLRVKGRDLKDQAKIDWDRKMAELEPKRKIMADKLAELGKSSAEAWKDISKGAQSAWDELDKAFREAAREF